MSCTTQLLSGLVPDGFWLMLHLQNHCFVEQARSNTSKGLRLEKAIGNVVPGRFLALLKRDKQKASQRNVWNISKLFKWLQKCTWSIPDQKVGAGRREPSGAFCATHWEMGGDENKNGRFPWRVVPKRLRIVPQGRRKARGDRFAM